ncbi:peroxiredoxin-like 2C isoform X2 [Mixophyes fleayi]|uniref:peroxiredoxin-like 2C isoform X2 n=1 Tax=Mixophyes fleayi TaxID=3061075 RepID=UPI003F4DD287
MASEITPITQQIGRDMEESSIDLYDSMYHPDLELAASCLLRDRSGKSFQFGDLYRDKKAIIVFVRVSGRTPNYLYTSQEGDLDNFLCYTCKEYVEDLAKIPKSFLQKADVRLVVIGQSSFLHIQQFCSLTGYPHEIYVDTDRDIYKKLGMKTGETFTASGSPHVKSNFVTGSIKSIWRAMKSPAFDFQGDPAQQGGALIVGPGNRVHFLHRDMNRYSHVPISSLLRYAGVQTVHFGNKPQILEV